MVALQWSSASAQAVGASWVITPVYAIAVGVAEWVPVTTELRWYKSFGSLGDYSGANLLRLRPIVTPKAAIEVLFSDGCGAWSGLYK